MPKQQPIYGSKGEQAIMLEIWDNQITDNPLDFVKLVFPWKKRNTPLEDFSGPRGWQVEYLQELAAHIRTNKEREYMGLPPVMWKSACASGRGVGKSALVAMLTLWFQSTRLGATTIVTANTEQQLKSRTWAELGKWQTMAINGHWFEMQALSMRPADWFMDAVKRDLGISPLYYYAAAQLWSEENPDAFAGIHNAHGVQLIFDEASGIPKPIWSVSEGFFTEPTPNRFWFVMSNPRRNSGSFFECFNANRNFWRTKHIDSRAIEGTDKQVYDDIIRQHGMDSYEARVEVLGQFPDQSINQLISRDAVLKAMDKDNSPVEDPSAPLLMGVDVARGGKNNSVIAFRRGRDARSIPWVSVNGYNTRQFADLVASKAQQYSVDAIFVDGNGVGGGVVDNLKAWKFKVIEVQAGGSATNPKRYVNKRVEMWDLMKQWLQTGHIPTNNERLLKDLTSPEFKYHGDNGKLQLESKEDMTARGVASPDEGDALAMTFAAPIARLDDKFSAQRRGANRARNLSSFSFNL